jgi:Ca-activated chloride channel family protein
LPDRLERAKREIRALAQRAFGDRLALVAFAGEARLLLPLTHDLDSFVELVDLADPLSVLRGGTDLGAALTVALEALDGGDSSHAAVLLITDGEDHRQSGRAVAEQCKERHIPVHCLGLGSPLGSKITIGESGSESFLRDGAGSDVVSALDSDGLRAIADHTGGGFATAISSPQPLDWLHQVNINNLRQRAEQGAGARQRQNRYQWPLLAAFLLGRLEHCMPDRMRRCSARSGCCRGCWCTAAMRSTSASAPTLSGGSPKRWRRSPPRNRTSATPHRWNC